MSKIDTSKPPTMKDVAKYAGVSLKTVSRAINNSEKVRPETREKVFDAIKVLGYRPNAVARSLRMKKTYSIGVVIADITNSFYSQIVRGIEDVALNKNYSILLANSDEIHKKEKFHTQVFIEKQVDGLIIVPSAGSKDYLKPIAKQVPVVLVDRDVKELELSSVTVDNEKASYNLTSHLLKHGYTKIGYISYTVEVTSGRKRLEGFKRALSDNNITLPKDYLKLNNKTVQDAFNAMKELIEGDTPPHAIFTSNNMMAAGVIKALDYYGLKPPKDIALVTFDDFKLADCFKPRLTVVSQPSYEIGKKAAKVLFEHLDGSRKTRKIVLPTELIIRESCGCIKT